MYSHRQEMSFHETANASVRRLAEGRELWAIPWPCLHEMLAIVTHPRIFDPPTPLELACDQVASWLEPPSLVVLAEPDGLYWKELRASLVEGEIRGPQVHDARIAALCLVHGVTELWSADRHFGRFPRLKVVNPLTTSSGPGLGPLRPPKPPPTALLPPTTPLRLRLPVPSGATIGRIPAPKV